MNDTPQFSKESISTATLFSTLAILSLGILSFTQYIIHLQWNFDDSNIVYRIVDNILSGHGWVYNVGEAYNASTSVLNTVIIAIVAYLSSDISNAAHITGSLSIFSSATLLFYLSREKLGITVSFIASMFLIYALANNLTWGLETHLFFALLLLFVLFETKEINSWWLLGILVLARPDAMLLVGFKWLKEWRLDKTTSLKGLTQFSMVLLPWVIFSLYNFGQVFPGTLSNKMWQGQSGFWGTGFVYLSGLKQHIAQYPPGSTFFGLIAIIGVVNIARNQKPMLYLLLFVLAQQSAYAILNVPGYHWYYSFLDGAILIAIAYGITPLLTIIGVLIRTPKALSQEINIPLLTLIIGLLTASHVFLQKEDLITRDGRDKSYTELSRVIMSTGQPTDTIAALEVGTIGFLTKQPMLDMISLTSTNPEFLSGKNSDVFFELAPETVIVHDPIWPMERAIADDPRFHRQYRLERHITSGAVPTRLFKLRSNQNASIDNPSNQAPTFRRYIGQEPLTQSNHLCVIDTINSNAANRSSTIIKSRQKDGHLLHFNGWLLNKNTQSTAKHVAIILRSKKDNTLYQIEGYRSDRPDVANAYSSDSYIRSGLIGEGNGRLLPTGTYETILGPTAPTGKLHGLCRLNVSIEIKP